MACAHQQKLQKAREQLVIQHRAIAEALAGSYKRADGADSGDHRMRSIKR